MLPTGISIIPWNSFKPCSTTLIMASTVLPWVYFIYKLNGKMLTLGNEVERRRGSICSVISYDLTHVLFQESRIHEMHSTVYEAVSLILVPDPIHLSCIYCVLLSLIHKQMPMSSNASSALNSSVFIKHLDVVVLLLEGSWNTVLSLDHYPFNRACLSHSELPGIAVLLASMWSKHGMPT